MGLLLALSCLLAACGLPRDPEGTLQRVQGGVLRVGAIEHPPFVEGTNGQPRGVEVALVEEFARRWNARIEWVPGTEHDLLPALEKGQLDLVVGGLVKDDPRLKKVGVSRPWRESRLSIGVDDDFRGESVEGVAVAVEDGTVQAHEVEKRGGRPVAVRDVASAAGPKVGENWQLEAWGLRPVGDPLQEFKRVIAVRPGENRTLVALDRHLKGRG